MRVLIIAEAGVNHNGDIKIAKKLIDVAAEAGADLIKFQTFSADRLVTQTASKAKYQMLFSDMSESQQTMLRKLELTEPMHRELQAHCALRKIGFFSTGFDIESTNMLVNLGQTLFKIPSGEITNFPYLQHIGRLKKSVILSTGMSNLQEIGSALDVLEKSGTSRRNITVLQCTSAYPAPMFDVNLLAMQTIRREFQVEVGYSDHTLGIEISLAAVTLGASVIEKHLTLDRNSIGPDHNASIEPAELMMMVKSIRNIEVALGDGVKRLMPSEVENQIIARKSIVAKQSIKAGQILTEQNLTSKRPGSGISPMEWNNLIGKVVTRDYSVDELIDEP